MDIRIEKECKKDYKKVEIVIEKAFKNAEHTDNNEHTLVSKLRDSNEFIEELSLVAKDKEKIVGHILLTKAFIKNEENEYETLALAPLAVLEEYQSKGIGKSLINESIKIAKELGYKSIIVLGHENYYPKFGFKKASIYSIKAPFEVPDEAFMALELYKDSLKEVNGTVIYSSKFFE